ncbi:hypothetical protein [Rhizomonospora bruguierae]|uniref:hypothetical protein n=1 Tax=Rhizomonospora bruguierae TaxID=1581705 RepID=UPI001BD16E9B|nr:hypothetical protein [Micromonospora sp. NBRC 107566]
MAQQVTRLLPRPTGRHRSPAAMRWWPPPISATWLREWWIALVSAAAIVITILVVAVALASSGSPATTTTAGSSPTEAPVATTADDEEPDEETPPPPEPTARSTTTPPPPRATATRPVGPQLTGRLARFATGVQQQVAAGNLAADAGRDLLRQVYDLAARSDRGNGRGRLRELDRRLNELRREGKLNRAGYEALSALT